MAFCALFRGLAARKISVLAAGLVLLGCVPPAVAAEASRPSSDPAVIVSAQPTRMEAEEGGVHGQLAVAPEVAGAGSSGDLRYAIETAPRHGQVGLAGVGEGEELFRTKTSRLGYFAYRAEEGFVGEDSFTYSVRNEASGLVFLGTVAIAVKPPPAVVMEKFEISAERERPVAARGVALTTRPNIPVSRTLPSHVELVKTAAVAEAVGAKVVYRLDDRAKARHGTARLDAASGLLTYAPDPGFIGEDRLRYYTIDQNNPQLGMENEVVIAVEPIREVRRLAVDRSRSREVDLVFVINNSPSMAAHQSRLAAGLGRFRQLFHARDLDYRIGVLTTDFVNAVSSRRPEEQRFFKEVRSVQIDATGNPVNDARGRPRTVVKQVASNGALVTLPVLSQPWVTPSTPDGVFAELVKVGTNGDSNRTAFTAIYNFVAAYHNGQHAFLRPNAPTIVVLFMDEEETRMASWGTGADGRPDAEWVEDGKLPDLIRRYNARGPAVPQTLEGYINQWVLRPFIVAKGNRRGSVELHAVVTPTNVSHRRAAELTGGTVLNINDDFAAPLAALGDRIADTVAVALDPVASGAIFYAPSLRVRVDGRDVQADPRDGFIYDPTRHSVRFEGAAKRLAQRAKIELTYEEHR
jgi:hypothetical protein